MAELAYPILRDAYFPAFLAIMGYTVIFSLFYTYVPLKYFMRTFWIPYSIYGIIVYLSFAFEHDWNFKIITLDFYMALGLILPLIGIIICWMGWFFNKKFQPFKHLTTKKQKLIFILKYYLVYQFVFSGLALFSYYYWMESTSPAAYHRLEGDISLILLIAAVIPPAILLLPIMVFFFLFIG